MKFRELNIGDVFITNDHDSMYIKTQDAFIGGDLKFPKALKLSTLEDIIFLENAQVELVKRKEDINWEEILK